MLSELVKSWNDFDRINIGNLVYLPHKFWNPSNRASKGNINMKL